MIDNISQELTPMVATARKVKQEHPDAKVVFVGPCASKNWRLCVPLYEAMWICRDL